MLTSAGGVADQRRSGWFVSVPDAVVLSKTVSLERGARLVHVSIQRPICCSLVYTLDCTIDHSSSDLIWTSQPHTPRRIARWKALPHPLLLIRVVVDTDEIATAVQNRIRLDLKMPIAVPPIVIHAGMGDLIVLQAGERLVVPGPAVFWKIEHYKNIYANRSTRWGLSTLI